MAKRGKTAVEILAKYELDEVDKRILQLKLKFPGISDTDLGSQVNLGRGATRARILRKPWQDAYNELVAPPAEAFEKALRRIARKYLALTDCGDPKVEERVCRAILISHGILKTNDDNARLPEPTIIELPAGERVIMGVKPAVDAILKTEKAD